MPIVTCVEPLIRSKSKEEANDSPVPIRGYFSPPKKASPRRIRGDNIFHSARDVPLWSIKVVSTFRVSERLNLTPIKTFHVTENRETHVIQKHGTYRSTSMGARSAGFRLDPAEQLERVHQELSSLHQVHAADPILGVDFEEEESVSCTFACEKCVHACLFFHSTPCVCQEIRRMI